MDNYIIKAAKITPSERQVAYQEMEFIAFIHYTVNAFTDKEWGYGNESTEIFNPSEFDPRQWISTCKEAGVKGIILTCKHHDGFCLWPSKYTEHSVKNSPWENGNGDMVKEVSEACEEYGLKFGVYLSPWDRNSQIYGTSEYNEYFKNQLKELLTNYGEVFCVWFDGACGEGPNGKKQVYDWDGYYKVIRQLQPNAVISVCGPDVRWCGNEAGHCRTSEWSVVPATLRDNEKIASESQKVDDGKFVSRISTSDDDLGSREKIKNIDKLVWYPAEVNTSIRPGWFYHEYEDGKVKSLEELLNVYYGSVGGNANFLLNIPPDKRGIFHENDVKRLLEFGETIRKRFSVNYIEGSSIKASEIMDDEHKVENMVDGNKYTYWCPNEGTEKAEIIVELGTEKEFDTIVLQEQIRVGQRIEKFKIKAMVKEKWTNIYDGTVIGHKKICSFEKVTSKYIKIIIEESRWYPTISNIGVYFSDN